MRKAIFSSRIVAALCFLHVTSLAAPALAQQSATATLGGRITDSQGDVVVGATVVATNRATGAERRTVSTEEGIYAIPSLAAGEYEVRASAAGFSEKVFTGVLLQVGQTVTLDSALAPAGADEQVTVSAADADVIDATTSAVDGVVNSREIEALPLNGRNYIELALLIPGNAPAPNFSPSKSNTLVISSAGQLGRSGNISIDGAENHDDSSGGQLLIVSKVGVRVFQIATNRFSADVGRSGSAVINVVTKSGTNELHGSASFFERDSALQGLPAVYDRRLDKAPFDRQQVALGVGGPVVRDRAWWFGAFEYRNQDGTIIVGARDTATRTIVSGFADAPLDDLLASGRFDWDLDEANRLTVRYGLERQTDVAPTTLIRAIGSPSQRQDSLNKFQSALANWTRTISATAVNSFSFSVNNSFNRIVPVEPGPQYTFPSVQDGASFRIPQQTRQNRLQFADILSLVAGAHTLKFGGEYHRVDNDYDLRVFQQGRVELIQDFPDFDRNQDGVVDDDDLLFAVTLRSGFPERPLVQPDVDNDYLAGFVQDDWRVHPQLTLNLGVRYEFDTGTKNISHYDELNPVVLPFLGGERTRDKNNFGPRLGFNYTTPSGETSIHGGYGIYYDRVVLQLLSLERGLDGRNLPIVARAGNVQYLDPATGLFRPGAPVLSNPFTGFVFPGAGAFGINVIDNGLENPTVQQFNLGVEHRLTDDIVARADYLHNFGTHFIVGRAIGTVYNDVIGGPDRVINIESSAKTKYDGLLLSLEKRPNDRYGFRASYTLAKAFNYANDDQIPFGNGPVDPTNLQLEYGPTPNDQRHRFTAAGQLRAPWDVRLSAIWTVASGVPMDILLPDGSSRVPQLQRNAGGRIFETGAELNAFLRELNAAGGVNGLPLPYVRDDVKFSDGFNSFDVRVSKLFAVGEQFTVEPMVEAFNLFNVTNILGVSNVNYSGYANALVRDSNNPSSPGFLTSSQFGRPVSTAGGVFGSGGPRAFQLAVRATF
jgi:hypothetical protein